MRSILRHLIQAFFFNNQGFLLIHTPHLSFTNTSELKTTEIDQQNILEQIHWKMNQYRRDGYYQEKAQSHQGEYFRGMWS